MATSLGKTRGNSSTPLPRSIYHHGVMKESQLWERQNDVLEERSNTMFQEAPEYTLKYSESKKTK